MISTPYHGYLKNLAIMSARQKGGAHARQRRGWIVLASISMAPNVDLLDCLHVRKSIKPVRGAQKLVIPHNPCSFARPRIHVRYVEAPDEDH